MTGEVGRERAASSGPAMAMWVWLLLAVLCVGVCQSLADQVPAGREKPVDENKVKAVFIYNFLNFVTWPDAQDSEVFTVAVIGPSVITSLLEDIAEKKESALGKPIQIRQLQSTEEIGHCHILFIPKSQNDQIEEIMNRTENTHILTVSEGEGLATKGVGINLIRVGEKVKIEINKGVTDREGLRINPQLLNVARLIMPSTAVVNPHPVEPEASSAQNR